MPTINDLRQQAATIKNAMQVGENTANRVGTTFETIADLLESMGGVANLSTIDIGSIDTLNTTGDMLVGTPNIYTLTMTRGSNTFKVGTLFQFANNGRYDVAQVIVSQYIIDSDGRIDTTSADQEVHIFYRLCKTMNGGSLPTPIGTWTTWTELGGSGGSGVTVDPYPTQNSGNAVSSGGVFERLQDVAPKVDISEIDDIDEYSDMLATKSPYYIVTKTISNNVFRIGTLMEFANQGRYILYQILATDYVLNDDGTLDTTLSENGGLKLIWRMKQFSGNPPAGVTIGVWSTWAKFGDSGYQPDGEDIDLNASDQLQFANKLYDASAFSGLGRVYLRKNIVTLEGVGKNVLTQAMVNTANTIYHIQYDYDLNGQTITLLAGCVLEFDGGSVKNGTITGNASAINSKNKKIFDSVTITGTWTTPFTAEYFGAIGDGQTDDSAAFNSMFASFVGTQNKSAFGTQAFTPTLLAESTLGYKLTQQVGTTDKNINFKGTIFLYHGTGNCFLFTGLWNSNISIDAVEHVGDTHWVNTNLTALRLVGIQRCTIKVGAISHFRFGVYALASANTAYYSNIHYLNAFYYTMKCFAIETQGTGWANHNYVYGGVSDYLTGELFDTAEIRYLFGVESVGQYKPNAWCFVDNGIEGGYVADTTASHFVNSFYFYVSPTAQAFYFAFSKGRIEALNNLGFNCVVGNSEEITFEKALYEVFAVRKTIAATSDEMLAHGIVYAPRKYNFEYQLVFTHDGTRYLQDYSSCTRGGNVQPAYPYFSDISRIKSEKFSTGRINGRTIIVDTRGGSFILHKFSGSRVTLSFWDNNEMTLGGSDFRSNIGTYLNIQSLKYANGAPFYWLYADNVTYVDTYADMGDAEFTLQFKVPTNSPIRYIAISVDNNNKYEIYKAGEKDVKFYGNDVQEFPSNVAAINNANICLVKGHRYRLNNTTPFDIICTKDGTISDLRNALGSVTATATKGSNVVTIDKNETYFWLGQKIWINDVRVTIIGIDTANKQLTIDTSFSENYTGLIVVPLADYKVERANFTSAELANIATNIGSGFAIGSEVFNITENKPYYWNGTTWVDNATDIIIDANLTENSDNAARSGDVYKELYEKVEGELSLTSGTTLSTANSNIPFVLPAGTYTINFDGGGIISSSNMYFRKEGGGAVNFTFKGSTTQVNTMVTSRAGDPTYQPITLLEDVHHINFYGGTASGDGKIRVWTQISYIKDIKKHIQDLQDRLDALSSE